MLLTQGNWRIKKKNFWNELFHLVSCIPQNEMVVLAGDMNGHVGSSYVGYDGMHSGCWCGYLCGVKSRQFAYGPADVLVPCGRLSWLLPAFDCTLISQSYLLTYLHYHPSSLASLKHTTVYLSGVISLRLS